MLKLSDDERNQGVFQRQQTITLPRIAFRHANVKTQGGYSQRKKRAVLHTLLPFGKVCHDVLLGLICAVWTKPVRI